MQIELLKPHTHAGKRINVGDRLDLNDASARWLIEQGVARAATAAAAPTTDSKHTSRNTTSGAAATQGD